MSATPTVKLTDLPVPPGFNCIKEGTASVLVPNGNQVFYNEVQEFNRDLSVLVISQFSANTMKQKHDAALSWVNKKAEAIAKKEAAAAATATTTTATTTTTTTQNGTKKQKTEVVDQVALDMNDLDFNAIAEQAKASTQLVSLTDQVCTQHGMPPKYAYKGLHIFEALSASGIRSIRYYNEIPYVNTIHVNDMDTQAVESIHRNLLYNQIPMDRVIPNKNEATAALYANRAVTRDLVEKLRVPATPTLPQRPAEMAEDDPLAFLYNTTSVDAKSIGKDASFDIPLWNVVDLDPYGSAAPFLDAAIQAIADGGLLCVTCTDSAVLCGNYPETGFGKYNAAPLHNYYGKEYGLRMLLHTIESTASRYGRYIVPLVTFSIDFYVRVFVTVHTSQAATKFSGAKHSTVFHCTGCRSFYTQPVMETTPDWTNDVNPHQLSTKAQYNVAFQRHDAACRICGGKLRVGGPVWNRELHDKKFVKELLLTLERRQQQYGGLTTTTIENIVQEQEKEQKAQEEEQQEENKNTNNNEDTTMTEENTEGDNEQQKKKNNKKNKNNNNNNLWGPDSVLNKEDFDNAPQLPPVQQQKTFGTYPRMKGMLTMAYKELDTMFYYDLPTLSQVSATSMPKLAAMQAPFVNAGYQISESHCGKNIFKTNAEPEFVWDVVRAINLKDDAEVIKKDWSMCSPAPRPWVANGKILDEKEEVLVFGEEELAAAEEFANPKPSNETEEEQQQQQKEETNNMEEEDKTKTTTTTTTPTKVNITHLKTKQQFEQVVNHNGRKNKLNTQQVMAQWLLSRQITHTISFKPWKRDKTKIFFATPAFWGPKAAGGTFSNKHYDQLTAQQTNALNPEDAAKNISRALAFAQYQKSLDNQPKKRKKNQTEFESPKKSGAEANNTDAPAAVAVDAPVVEEKKE